jgi:hypothetical protein
MKKKTSILIAVLAIVAITIGAISSSAWFSDSGTSDVASISSGTLSIDENQVHEVVLGVIDNMAPGDETGTATITIVNDGTLNLAWFGNLIVEGDTDLANVIYIKDAEMKFLSPTNQNWQPAEGPCALGFTPVAGPDHFITNGLGSGCWPTAWTGPDNLATLSVYDGNSGMNTAPFENMGALKPGYKYQLTLQFGFWEGAGNYYQHLGPMTIKYYVYATQIKAGALEALYPTFSNHLGWLNTQISKQTGP